MVARVTAFSPTKKGRQVEEMIVSGKSGQGYSTWLAIFMLERSFTIMTAGDDGED